MFTRASRVFMAIALAALSASGVSAESPSESDSADGEPTAITADEAFLFDAQSYADAYEISLEEGIRRLELLRQFNLGRLELEAAEPTRFAGGWVEHWPQFQMVVRFKGTAELSPATAALIPGNLGIDVEFGAPNTLAELLDGQKKVIATVSAKYPDMSIGISARTGAVRLTGPTILTAKELSELGTIAGVPVTAEVTPAISLDHTYGGKLIDVFISPYVYSCTTGFTVKDAVSGITGVMTAGHCFPDDATYHESPTISYLADLSGKRWDANQDFAWYQTSHPEFPKFYDGFALRTQTGTQPRLQMEGNPVCHYGITTGYSCGVVDDIHFVPATSSGICNGLTCDPVWVQVVDNGPNDINCQGGDSGGPYFWTNIAWGTHSGGAHVGGPTGPCVYTIMFSVGGLQWDGVNTRVLLP